MQILTSDGFVVQEFQIIDDGFKLPNISICDIFYVKYLLTRTYFSLLKDERPGGSLRIKMADGGIERSIFIVKHDGSIDFLINRKTAVQEPVKVRVFSHQDL